MGKNKKTVGQRGPAETDDVLASSPATRSADVLSALRRKRLRARWAGWAAEAKAAQRPTGWSRTMSLKGGLDADRNRSFVRDAMPPGLQMPKQRSRSARCPPNRASN